MPILVQCSGCQKKLRAPDNAAGKTICCPECKTLITVPQPEEEFEKPEEEFETPDENTAVSEKPSKGPPKIADDAAVPDKSSAIKKKPAWEEDSGAGKKKPKPPADDESYGVSASEDEDDDEFDDDRPRRKKKRSRFEDDDEDSDVDLRRRLRSRRGDAASKVFVPALILIILATCSMIFRLVFGTINVVTSQPPPNFNNPEAYKVGQVCGFLFMVLWDAAILHGAFQMKGLANYRNAMLAAIFSCVPICSLCYILGIPFGIWSIVVLLNQDVRSAFSE